MIDGAVCDRGCSEEDCGEGVTNAGELVVGQHSTTALAGCWLRTGIVGVSKIGLTGWTGVFGAGTDTSYTWANVMACRRYCSGICHWKATNASHRFRLASFPGRDLNIHHSLGVTSLSAQEGSVRNEPGTKMRRSCGSDIPVARGRLSRL